jgi:hypothetical protein
MKQVAWRGLPSSFRSMKVRLRFPCRALCALAAMTPEIAR